MTKSHAFDIDTISVGVVALSICLSYFRAEVKERKEKLPQKKEENHISKLSDYSCQSHDFHVTEHGTRTHTLKCEWKWFRFPLLFPFFCFCCCCCWRRRLSFIVHEKFDFPMIFVLCRVYHKSRLRWLCLPVKSWNHIFIAFCFISSGCALCVGPKGERGEAGPQGPPGPQGKHLQIHFHYV